MTGDSLAAYLARCSGDGACLHRTAPYGAEQSKWQQIWAFPESWPIAARFATVVLGPNALAGAHEGTAASLLLSTSLRGVGGAAQQLHTVFEADPDRFQQQHALSMHFAS